MSNDRAMQHLDEVMAGVDARWRLVPIGRLRELEEEFEACRRSGELDDRFSKERIGHFAYAVPQREPPAAALLIVAVRAPQIKIGLTYMGRRRSVMLPPTYLSYIDGNLLKTVQDAIGPWGHWVERTVLPLKLLAARSGLLRYGRNNIGYIEGFGSYFRLTTFMTDLGPLHSHWEPPRMLDRCATCNRCVAACRTGAIVSDRFLVHAERCLTYLNERPDDFPAWIEPSVHHCITGCMFCQRACPENRERLQTREITEPFREEEIAAIMEGVSRDRLDPGTIEKLTKLDLYGDYQLLGRNLRAVLDRRHDGRGEG